MNFRLMEEKDLPFFCTVRNLSREFLHDPREFSLEETQAWFKNLPAEKKYYIIEFESANESLPSPCQLGYFRTHELPGEFRNSTLFCHVRSQALQIGADLHPVHRGKGWAYKSYVEFINQLDKGKYDRLSLEVLANNIPAYNLYKKLGFQVEYLTDHNVAGRLVPNLHMNLSLADFKCK